MENKNGHTNRPTLFKDRIQNALDKLSAFCTPHSSLKADEETMNTFERFLIPIPLRAGNTEDFSSSEYFAIVEEILQVLNELEQELNSVDIENQIGDTSQVDSSNRLYASLKRHPE